MSSPAYRRLLRDQHGVIGRDQLYDCGWSPQRITRALARGDLCRFAGTSVFRSAAHVTTPEALVLGTLRWLGGDGVLIGRAAAWWWGMLREPPEPLDFSGPKRASAPPRGSRLHRVYVDPLDRTVHRDAAVLTKPMAGLRAAADLERTRPGAGLTFIDRAIQQGLDPSEFIGILTRHRCCTGNALGRYLTDITSDRSESIGERRTAALMASAGLTGWRQNVWVATPSASYRLDFAFERERVAVEFDGFAFHGKADRFAADRIRDDDLAAAGWRVVHVTWRALHATPDDVVRRIKRALAR